jgi:hypothetical protein
MYLLIFSKKLGIIPIFYLKQNGLFATMNVTNRRGEVYVWSIHINGNNRRNYGPF